MNTKTTKKLALLCLAVVLFVAACGGTGGKPAALSDEEVRQVAESSLRALDEGDKAAFVENFSTTMKEAYNDQEFENLRALLAESSGKLVSCGEPQLSNIQGYARYSFPCEYEKEEVAVTFVFEVGGSLVEGLFFNSANLRSMTQ
jgi:hypothetical protein